MTTFFHKDRLAAAGLTLLSLVAGCNFSEKGDRTDSPLRLPPVPTSSGGEERGRTPAQYFDSLDVERIISDGLSYTPKQVVSLVQRFMGSEEAIRQRLCRGGELKGEEGVQGDSLDPILHKMEWSIRFAHFIDEIKEGKSPACTQEIVDLLIRPTAVQDLALVLNSKGIESGVKGDLIALFLLNGNDPQSIKRLLKLLDLSPENRALVSEERVWDLFEAMRSDGLFSRSDPAIELLFQIGCYACPHAAPYELCLNSLQQYGEYDGVRSVAARILGYWSARADEDLLLSLLDEPDCRDGAIIGLSLISSAKGAQEIEELFKGGLELFPVLSDEARLSAGLLLIARGDAAAVQVGVTAILGLGESSSNIFERRLLKIPVQAIVSALERRMSEGGTPWCSLDLLELLHRNAQQFRWPNDKAELLAVTLKLADSTTSAVASNNRDQLAEQVTSIRTELLKLLNKDVSLLPYIEQYVLSALGRLSDPREIKHVLGNLEYLTPQSLEWAKRCPEVHDLLLDI